MADIAAQIQGNLQVVSPSAGRTTTNLIYLSYRNPKPDIASEVLTQMIQTYFRKHLQLHRSTEAFDLVSKQTDEARSNLRLTEEAINQLKNKSGVLTIEATMQEFESRRLGIREKEIQTEAQLAEQRAKVMALQKANPSGSDVASDNKNVNENTAVKDGGNPTASVIQEDRERTLALAEYSDLAERLSLLQQKRNSLLVTRKPSDPMLNSLDTQISQVRKQGIDLLEKYPELSGKMVSEKSGQISAPVLSLGDEKALEAAFSAKLVSI
ncbi:MAG: hypothetical protein EOP06_15415, partial [Proteobacteria bacterium]